MNDNPYESPHVQFASAGVKRRRMLRDWIMLAALAAMAAPILFGLELCVVYALQWFGVWF